MDKPNILLITTDQQRFDTVASVGDRNIYTPHLDWLRHEGIAFSRAYTDCPICMPARATIMTGKHGYTTGLLANSGHVRPMADNPTLPGVLTGAGYQTRAQGKMHFSPMRANYGFEHMELPMDYLRERHERAHEGLPKQHGVGENEYIPAIDSVDETHSLTRWTVKRSIDFLESRDSTRPFFLWTSFGKPHPPFAPCANFWSLYANRDLPPAVLGDWSKDRQAMAPGLMTATYALNNTWDASESQLRDTKRAYYACVTQVDYQLGMLFARMREMHMLENTWIIFTSDHGEMMGDHHMFGKGVFLEGSAHIPLIVRPPSESWDRSKPLARTVDTLVDLADIMPTILNIAGADVPEDVDGIDLMSLIGETTRERTFFGNSSDTSFVIIEGQYKYTITARGGAELLFDLIEDPGEQHNLIDDETHRSVLKQLKAKLLAQMESTGSERIKDGEFRAVEAPAGPDEMLRWPGFHSTVHPCDVIH